MGVRQLPGSVQVTAEPAKTRAAVRMNESVVPKSTVNLISAKKRKVVGQISHKSHNPKKRFPLISLLQLVWVQRKDACAVVIHGISTKISTLASQM